MHTVALALAVSSFQLGSPAPTCSGAPHGRHVPTDIVADILFARWHLNNGETMRFYLDTGGPVILFPEAVPRLGLDPRLIVSARDTVRGVYVPGTIGDSTFPLPLMMLHADPTPADTSPVRVIPSRRQEDPEFRVDGGLGAYWFAGRVWTIDYPHGRLYFDDSAPAHTSTIRCWVPLGFQVDSTGQRTTQFPRITASVAGESLDFLVDTGAWVTLTDSAWRVIGTGEPRHRAASFIDKSVFDRWHSQHPNWQVVRNAAAFNGFMDMIQVPKVDVGGQQIGPVWFAAQPTFRQFMAQYMDKPVDGALGGSAWKYVTLVLDYPRARAAVLTGTAH